TTARSLHADVHTLDAEAHRLASALLRRHRRREGRALLRALEPRLAGRAPRHGVAVAVGDGHRGVVESGADVRHSLRFHNSLRLFPGRHTLFGYLLLARDRAARPLLGARIGVGALTPHRQAAAVPDAAIRSDVHQSLDVHRHFGAQRALDL